MIVFSVRSQRLFSIVKLFVYTMKIIGLAPFGVHKSSVQIRTFNSRVKLFQYSKIGLAYNILLSIMTVLSCIAVVKFCQPFKTTSVDSVTQIVNNFVGEANVYLVNLTVCLILITWGFRQEKAASVMNQLLEVDLGLTSFEKPPFNKCTLICAIIHVLLTTLTWSWYGILLTSYYKGQACIWKTISYFLKKSVIFGFIAEYFIVVGLVANDIEAVNDYLVNFRETGTYLFPLSYRDGLQATECSSSSQDLAYRKLIHYHAIRTRLYKLCGEIGDFFSLPILFCIAFCFVTLFRSPFKPLRYSKNDETPPSALASVLVWIAVDIMTCAYPIVSLALNVTRIIKAAQRTRQIVDTLSEVAIRREIISELELFSSQLLHEDVSFTAHGFFSLDSSLLLSMLGGTITYFIALMQLPDKKCN